MKQPTLIVLAAGMGSRYGGLKQLDGVGPSGETIMDYSIFDAIRAGCIPIYWGSEGCPEPEILNQEAILFYDPDNPDALLQQVRRLESDPEYYAEFISRPPFKEDAADKIWQMIDGLRDKLDKVINQH